MTIWDSCFIPVVPCTNRIIGENCALLSVFQEPGRIENQMARPQKSMRFCLEILLHEKIHSVLYSYL